MRQKDEKSLIELARRHDQAAMSELYNRNVDAIYRYVFHRVSDSAVAEDLTGEVFLRALEGIGHYQDTGAPFSAWLYRIAHARVVDHWRQQHRHPQDELDESLPDTASRLPGIEPGADTADLQQALRQLSDDQQQVIVLKFFGRLGNDEIAHVLNKTEGAVKALQHRALASLARILEKKQ